MASTTGDMRGGYDASTSTMLVSQSGWVVFAALMLLFSGIWIAVEGIIAFFRSAWYIGNPVFGSLWLWSIAWLGFGVLLVAAGTAVMSGQAWARWFGIVIAGLAALVQMATFATYPWWSAVMVAVDLLVIFGLAARWQRGEGAPY